MCKFPNMGGCADEQAQLRLEARTQFLRDMMERQARGLRVITRGEAPCMAWRILYYEGGR